MGWISVRDSLPKLFTEVLITVRNRCTDFSNTYYGQRGNNYWQFWDYSKILEITDEDENYEVQSWMRNGCVENRSTKCGINSGKMRCWGLISP